DDIIDLAAQGAAPPRTPGDFPLARLSAGELAGLLQRHDDIQDIYPLSPMQQAMLIHTLAAGNSTVNFEQSCTRIRGPFDLEAFRHAWTRVFERHDILRTSFHWQGLAQPQQVVHRAVAL